MGDKRRISEDTWQLRCDCGQIVAASTAELSLAYEAHLRQAHRISVPQPDLMAGC